MVFLSCCTNALASIDADKPGKPFNTSGEIIDSGDLGLDSEVKSAIALIQKLANNERIKQVFARHAFDFWIGRTDTRNGASVLQDAHRVYKERGGSMNALLTLLLTSVAFLYHIRQSTELAEAN